MITFVTVKQLTKAVEMIQAQRPDIQQQSLKEFAAVLQLMDPRAKISIKIVGPIRFGRVCEVMELGGTSTPKA